MGTIGVEESDTTRDALAAPVWRWRALFGVTVRVAVATDDGSFRMLDETLTDRHGRFRLRADGAASAQRHRLLMSLAGPQLTVSDDAPPRALVVRELADGVPSALVDVGTITVCARAPGELGDHDNVRRALAWYIARSAMEFLSGFGAGFSFAHPITVRYPVVSRTGASYACRVTRTAIVHRDTARDDWSVERVLRQIMRLWASQCVAARALWPPERVAHGDAIGSVDGIDDRFAELATKELLALIWNSPISR